MADKVAKALRQAAALERVQIAARVLGERFSLPAVELTPQGRDPEMVRAAQLEAVAELLEGMVNAVGQGPVPSGKDALPASAVNTAGKRKGEAR